jgi:hypothetical protein
MPHGSRTSGEYGATLTTSSVLVRNLMGRTESVAAVPLLQNCCKTPTFGQRHERAGGGAASATDGRVVTDGDERPVGNAPDQ